ncbi:tyrosine-protein phosphatase [Oceanobacillus luteolus]|uniref:Tyrosine-protein phosphatase n=1 Tax=Oceanobacillus luteolus TaxID=1274358 RepID=A0ABW4HP13_9BACI
MIDIHSHILPGVDDGAQTEEDSLKMARVAVKNGITAIVATPHHKNGVFENDRESILRWVETLNELLVQNDIPLTVLPGQETRINGDMLDELREGIVLPINNSKYVFVEFPSAHVPRYASQMLYDIQLSGYIPVIVHPERNQELMEKPSKLYDFIKRGSLSQVTAGSLVGKFGKDIQKFSRQIINANLTHFIASDAHNTKSRGFHLTEAYRFVEREFGTDYLYMFQQNSHLLVDDQSVHRLEPMQVKRKKILGLF